MAISSIVAPRLELNSPSELATIWMSKTDINCPTRMSENPIQCRQFKLLSSEGAEITRPSESIPLEDCIKFLVFFNA